MYEFILIVTSTHPNIRVIPSFSTAMKNLEENMFNLAKKLPYDKDKI